MSNSANNTATAEPASPMEQAMAATVQKLFATGQISLDMPDEAVVDAVRRFFPHIATDPQKLVGALRNEVDELITRKGVDEAAVRVIADKLFQSCYADN